MSARAFMAVWKGGQLTKLSAWQDGTPWFQVKVIERAFELHAIAPDTPVEHLLSYAAISLYRQTGEYDLASYGPAWKTGGYDSWAEYVFCVSFDDRTVRVLTAGEAKARREQTADIYDGWLAHALEGVIRDMREVMARLKGAGVSFPGLDFAGQSKAAQAKARAYDASMREALA